jgi:hypothetical protein
MFAELLGFPSGELGRAVNLPHRFQNLGGYYENTYPRSNSLLFDVPRHGVALLRPARRKTRGSGSVEIDFLHERARARQRRVTPRYA